MHTCMRCGRAIRTVEELQCGCSCGSKAFVFTKSAGDELALTSPCFVPAINVQEKAAGENAAEETNALHPPAGISIGEAAKSNEAHLEDSGSETAKQESGMEREEALPEAAAVSAPAGASGLVDAAGVQQATDFGVEAFAAQAQQIPENMSADAAGNNATATGAQAQGLGIGAQAAGEKSEDAPLPPVIEGESAHDGFLKTIEEGEKEKAFEVENVRLLESGVFEVDVLSLAKNPLVLKDHNDVYYVKLPLSKYITFFGNGKPEKEASKENEKKKNA